MIATQAIQYAPQCGDLTVESFWCTVVASVPNPLADNYVARPLKEFIIKVLVINGQKPLTLDFKTFCKATELDYNQGTFIAHPYLEVVKAELAKIAINKELVQKTLVNKSSFPVAWRILFTFVVQVLGGNYSSTEQVNSIP
ncbi:hypothetical protein Tco_0373887 [Tanacetum coccineum]